MDNGGWGDQDGEGRAGENDEDAANPWMNYFCHKGQCARREKVTKSAPLEQAWRGTKEIPTAISACLVLWGGREGTRPIVLAGVRCRIGQRAEVPDPQSPCAKSSPLGCERKSARHFSPLLVKDTGGEKKGNEHIPKLFPFPTPHPPARRPLPSLVLGVLDLLREAQQTGLAARAE